jgi:chemotaxis protein MotB
MLTRPYIGLALVAAGLVLSGCVSSGKFKKMEAQKNDEIAALDKQRSDLEARAQSLEQQKTTLEADNTALKQQVTSLQDEMAVITHQAGTLQQQKSAAERQVGSLQQQSTAIQRQVGTLQQEKAALLAASKQREAQYQTLVGQLSTEVRAGQIQVRQYQDMLTVDVAEQLFFDSGRAKLKPGGKDVLKKVGDVIKDYENKIIRVAGHTDNVPISKALQATFPTNWELSVARATTVVRFLQEVGVPPERMIASGRGEYEPVAPNDTEEGRQKNRRIEIMLIDKSLVSELSRSTESEPVPQ